MGGLFRFLRAVKSRSTASGSVSYPAVDFRLQPADAVLTKRYALRELVFAFQRVQMAARVRDAASVTQFAVPQ